MQATLTKILSFSAKLAIILVALFCISLFVKGCNKPQLVDFDKTKDSLSNIVKSKFVQKDSIKKEREVKEQIRYVEVIKWRESKPIEIAKVDSIKTQNVDSAKKEFKIILQENWAKADSIIKHDSIIFAEFKHELKIDSILFKGYQTIAKNDSIQIFALKKEVKKEKRKKVVLAGALAVVIGLFVFK